jgi:hypothetical protein
MCGSGRQRFYQQQLHSVRMSAEPPDDLSVINNTGAASIAFAANSSIGQRPMVYGVM